MKNLMTVLLLTITAVQVTANAQDFAAARKMCENYGFTPNTSPFAQCVQTEIIKSKYDSVDSKQNEACLNRVNQIEQSVNRCALSCSLNNFRDWNANMACKAKCDEALNFAPVCKQ
jgi:hypothetical protein